MIIPGIFGIIRTVMSVVFEYQDQIPPQTIKRKLLN